VVGRDRNANRSASSARTIRSRYSASKRVSASTSASSASRRSASSMISSSSRRRSESPLRRASASASATRRRDWISASSSIWRDLPVASATASSAARWARSSVRWRMSSVSRVRPWSDCIALIRSVICWMRSWEASMVAAARSSRSFTSSR
jgi:hypothetical protein